MAVVHLAKEKGESELWIGIDVYAFLLAHVVDGALAIGFTPQLGHEAWLERTQHTLKDVRALVEPSHMSVVEVQDGL